MSQRGFDECFAELYRVAYRVGYRLLGNHEAAQDVAQEALTRAYVCWRRIDHGRSPTGWVAQVSVNLALKVCDRTQPEAVDGLLRASDEAVVELRADLVALLRELPPRQREVVVLRYLVDLSERDVAAALHCSPGTVKQHAHRGLSRLRSELSDVSLEVATDVRRA